MPKSSHENGTRRSVKNFAPHWKGGPPRSHLEKCLPQRIRFQIQSNLLLTNKFIALNCASTILCTPWEEKAGFRKARVNTLVKLLTILNNPNEYFGDHNNTFGMVSIFSALL